MYENSEQLFGGMTPLLEVIESVYAGVSDPSLWPSILDRIAEVLYGRQTFLFAETPDPAMPAVSISRHTDPEALTRFVGYYAGINPIAAPSDAAFREGHVRYSHWVVRDEELERTEFYNDFFRPFQMHWSCGVKIPVVEGAGPLYLSVQRPKSLPAFGDREGAVLKVLIPHFQRAFALHRQFASMGARISALESALDAFDHAVFGLDHSGMVVMSNRPADAIARSGDLVRVLQGRLCARSMACDRQLQPLIAGALSGHDPAALDSSSMLLPRPDGRQPLTVTTVPCRNGGSPGLPHLAALVFVSDPERKPLSRAKVLRALYGFTPAETRVADLLAQGLEIRGVAECLGLTLETSRFHVKRILSKAGVRRQSDLIRLILSVPGH